MGDPKRTPEVYDYKLVSALFGLSNDNGVLCYVNAVVQTLVSCSAFNKWFILHYEANKNDPLWQALRTFICRQNDKNQPELPVLSALRFQQALVAKLSGSRNRLEATSQEDFQEGLLLLLDSLSHNVDWLFHIHYQQEVTCIKCGHTEVRDQPPDCMVSITTKVEIPDDMRKAISDYDEFVDGHRCGKCSAINTATQNIVKTTKKLVNTSEILIIYYLKYGQKTVEHFPADLTIKIGNENRHYQIVAQIEHSGEVGTQVVGGRQVARGAQRGHYFVRAWRPKPPDYHERRTKMLAQRYASTPSLELQQAIKDWNEEKDNPMTFFHINDTKMHYPTGGFVCTPQTYMVVYHLMSM